MQLPDLSSLCAIGMDSHDPLDMPGNAGQMWMLADLEAEEAARGPQAHARDERAAQRESEKGKRARNTPEALERAAAEKRARQEKEEARARSMAAAAQRPAPPSNAEDQDELDALLGGDDSPAAAPPAAAPPAAAPPAAAPRVPLWRDSTVEFLPRRRPPGPGDAGGSES
tara:strand:- start:10 stop:519 length:510 start_codon:yes stop_codon:yes gene_type:complete